MTSAWWALVGDLVLAPMLALSAPPWAGLIMLLVRIVLGGLFLLAARSVVLVWLARWRRDSEPVHHTLTELLMPLSVVGLGLLLICSTDRGVVDRLFQRVDRVLMNGRFVPPPTEPSGGAWYAVLSVTEASNAPPESKDNKPGQE